MYIFLISKQILILTYICWEYYQRTEYFFKVCGLCIFSYKMVWSSTKAWGYLLIVRIQALQIDLEVVRETDVLLEVYIFHAYLPACSKKADLRNWRRKPCPVPTSPKPKQANKPIKTVKYNLASLIKMEIAWMGGLQQVWCWMCHFFSSMLYLQFHFRYCFIKY